MISNNTTGKLKASKGSRDLDCDESEEPDNFQSGNSTSRSRSNLTSNETRLHSTVVFSPKDGRIRSRPRNSTEFRGYRGQPGDRRGTGRPRGGYSSKNERDSTESSFRRFQEPMIKQNISDTNSSINYGYGSSKYECDSKSNFIYGLPEDPRISKLLRRLCGETDIEKSLAICAKLLDAIMLPDNVRYIRRSYEILGESLLDVLYDAPGNETKIQVAEALGRIGYVMGPDYKKHQDWIMGRFATQRSEDVKAMLILSFYKLFVLDSENPALDDYVPSAITQLQSVIEATDSAKIFTVSIDSIIVLSKSYPDLFSKHFIDMVDILVGWHVDVIQSKEVKDFALRTLGEFTNHWRADLVFSVKLLGQFLEDMMAYGEDLTQVTSGQQATHEETASPQECVQRITSFINVFNTVVKSLSEMLNPNVSSTITWNFLNESFNKMMKTYLTAIQSNYNCELVIAGNECIYLFLDYLQTKASSNFLFLNEIIAFQLNKSLEMTDKSLLTLLNLIRKTIKEISGNLPIEFIKTVIGKESSIMRLRISQSKMVQESVMSVFQYCLNLKNIPLLQDAYKYVLEDLENAYKTFVPDVEILNSNSYSYTKSDAQLVVLFNLQCLTDIANASNSIIGMWALQPSILELLAVRLKPYDQILCFEYPMLQYSVIYLLYSHCKKNNHFIASSDLVSYGQSRSVCDIFGISSIALGDVSNVSPTSGHFGIIVSLFNKLFKCKLQTDTMILVLNWTSDVYFQLQKYYPTVFNTKLLMDLVMNTIHLGFSLNKRIIEKVAFNMEIVFSNPNVTWNYYIMLKLGELALIHIDSNDEMIRSKFSNIICYVPWDIIILNLIKSSDVKSEKYALSKSLQLNKTNIVSAQKEHLMQDIHGQMLPHQFKTFMNYLLNDVPFQDGWLNNAFMNCWPLQGDESTRCHISFFRQCSLQFSSVLTMWSTWEAARLCISLKLRTPLGKPQETFTSIESAIKQLARSLTSQKIIITSDGGKDTNEINSVFELKRSRMLIEFLECLEKAIHNAAEGCATVMIPVIPTVRTFFHTNSSTCREWLSRVRPAALLVGLHSGHSSAVVRHAHSLILSCFNSNTNPALTHDLLSYCISLARALVQLQEPEALMGVYTWIKKNYHIKLLWLKAASEQSAMKYEMAIDIYYSALLKKSDEEYQTSDNIQEPTHILGDVEKQFLNDQVTECYKHIQNWQDLLKWKNKTFTTKEENVIEESISYDSQLESDFENFYDWEKLMICDSSPKQAWSCFNLFDSTEASLRNVATKVLYHQDGLTSNTESTEQYFETLQLAIHELSRNEPNEFLSNAHVLHYVATALKKIIIDRKPLNNPFYISSHLMSMKNINPSLLSKIIWWFEYFSKMNPLESDTAYIEIMRLDLVKSNRKHGNFNTATRELIKHFSCFKLQNISNFSINQLGDVYNIFVRTPNSYDMSIWTVNNVTAIMETSKLLYHQEETREMAINLCASASLGVSQRLTLAEHTYDLREKGTRMLLTLSKWVQNENDKILINNLQSPLTKLVTALPEIGLVNNNVSANVIPISDSAVGKLLQFSVNQCPGLAKAWFNFGSWCFRWGRKMVEYSSNTGGQLTENDKLQIQSVMLLGTPEDFDTICEILSKTRVTCDDEDIDWNEINTSEMIENQLRSVPSLRNAHPEHLTLLVDIWRQAQKRVFSYYELSADAYFKFLDLSSSSDNVNHNGECAIVTATLRLLRLIVKHAMELQNVLESGLANTPTHPWKVIIPQLFSRLNHPENYVRRRVSELLCRLAEDTPHLITFPAVVGAVENEKINLADISFPKSIFIESENIDADNEDAMDNSDTESEKDNDLNSCFMAMVETLSKQAPETILQVQILVKELRRINLLWDELWLGTLAQHHSEITRRLAQLDMEILKVKNNITLNKDEKEKLISEKHRIILKPILFVLEQLAEITSATPETPHEQYFQDKFLESINNMLEKLKNPSEPDKPQESWLPIKELQIKLQQKCSKRSSYVLKMSDISPTLSKMSNTVISMPGVHTYSNIRITIMSIHNTVAILPTKTKPKKLKFNGSDGKIYTYLFKGMEDLHLDERIMQFLSIANTMMAHDKEDNCDQTYRARHYSVIPLGPRSGLISWVDNLTPLFALYKRWQHREAVTMSAKNNKFISVLRPSELFYNKLTPLLNAAGVNTENRKEWPVNILKKVLVELMAETPKDLLAKELWCGSVTPGQWWRTVRRYSFSVAVMSTIGYIIGLGDRHLDNVLVDLSTGELVHIDYNVCFEKGKTLRVPEKVPFRMTPNLEYALGVTGVEGIFRLASEHVLKTAKRGRETLLTLLEAFVYDPLVEWGGGAPASTSSHAAGSASAPGKGRRARLERKCARDMLVVRIAEVRHDWNDNREEILKQMTVTSSNASNWLDDLRALAVAEGHLQHDHRQMALVKELEALGSDLSEHPLYATAKRYTTYKQMKDAFDESAKSLLDLFQDCDKKIENFTRALETVKGPQLPQWVQELNFPIDHDGHLVFDLIREFLLNAGQSTMITQCEQSEAELGQVARQQTLLIKTCVELLSQYAAVVQYYPQSFIEKHRIVLFRKWAGILLETDSPDICREVLTQIQNFLSADNINSPAMQQAAAFSYQIQSVLNETNLKLKKMYEKIQVEGGKDAMPRCENNFMDAKAAIRNFVMQENGSDKAIESVTISALCTLNRKYLMLESGAQSAGDSLVDLTSRDGEWFFDDMFIISSLITELIAFIPLHHNSSTKNDERISMAFDCLKAAKSIFVDLQELSYNFQMIILPEAIKKIQSEEPSVLLMINDLNTVVLNTARPLNELLSQLEVHLRYIIMEMESPAANSQAIAADLRARYEALVGAAGSDSAGSGPSAGRMLLMGSDGLFTPLLGRGPAILDALAALHAPHVWKKIDQIGEAKDLAAPLHNEHLRSILEDIFFIKRIQALTDFFSLCVQMSCAFKGVGAPTVFDDERLFKPIKRFIADYVGRQFLGVQSQCLGVTICLLLQRLGLNVNMEIEQRDIGVSWKVPLEELSEICINNCMKGGIISSSTLQQANALNANLEAAFRRREVIRVLEKSINMSNTSVSRLRLHSTAHTWLRYEGRPSPPPLSPAASSAPAGTPPLVPPIAEFKKLATQLNALQPRLATALEKHRSLVASAEQRLKWAAGANPALNEVMAAFECAVRIREDRLNVERNLAVSVGTVCGALGAAADHGTGKGLPNLAQRRRAALVLLARAAPPPPPLYESLLQLLTPDNGIDALWVNNVSALLTDMICQLQKHIGDLKSNLAKSEDTLKNSANKLANSKSIHEKLIFDAKGLLKSISKGQENATIKLQDYLIAHEIYMNDMTKLIDSLSTDNLTEEDVTLAIELSSKLEQETPDIYSDLISFEGGWQNEEMSMSKRRGTLVRQVAGVWSSPARQTPPKSRVIQQQNAYAASVWKRVRLKLEGRDPDPARKHSNQEQVDYILKEAMSLDNLCLLYEGWTPWV